MTHLSPREAWPVSPGAGLVVVQTVLLQSQCGASAPGYNPPSEERREWRETKQVNRTVNSVLDLHSLAQSSGLPPEGKGKGCEAAPLPPPSHSPRAERDLVTATVPQPDPGMTFCGCVVLLGVRTVIGLPDPSSHLQLIVGVRSVVLALNTNLPHSQLSNSTLFVTKYAWVSRAVTNPSHQTQ